MVIDTIIYSKNWLNCHQIGRIIAGRFIIIFADNQKAIKLANIVIF